MEDYYYNNWDLDAVVRFACRLSSPPPPPPPDPFSSLPPPIAVVKDEPFPDLSGGAAGQDADDLYKAFLAATPPPPAQPPPQPMAPRNQAPNQPSSPAKPQPSGRQASGSGSGTASRSKRRKNQQKKVVCQVPADGAVADMWAWRKYGQKPIKGSPYPRGYYRCSSSKGCVARKQVERSRTDPTTFVITYTAEHNHPLPTHRNSLSGTTRQKPNSATPPPTAEPSTAPSPSAQDDDDEGEDAGALLVEDMELVGEDELLFLKPEGPAMVDGGSEPTTLAAVLFGVTDDPGEAAAVSGGS